MNRAGRIERVLCRMAAERIDTLVALSNAKHHLARINLAAHLMGYRALAESALVLRADGTERLIVTPVYDAERAALRRPEPPLTASDDLAAALAELLRQRAPGRIATTGLGAIPHDLAVRLLDIVGKDALPFDDAVNEVTAPKTDEEIANARKAVAIAEQTHEHMLAVARAGLRECDLAVEMNLYAKGLGANDNFLMLSGGPHQQGVGASSNRPLERGDVIIAESTPAYDGQFGQICRSASVGTPSNVLVEKYALVVRAMTAGIEIIRPGIKVSDVAGAIDAVLTDAGYEKYNRPPYMNRRGHGMGAGSMAPGDIAIENHTILEEDMVFVVHPNQYLPETGYLLCGEPVRVTATGFESLSKKWAELGAVVA
ncbi:MAG TPA: M24 family metallopeptidase [Stellaceae bacterium]|jgi:Xaa-Pro aminopeptidase